MNPAGPPFALCLALALAGCAARLEPVVSESNYLTYDHAFTEAAALAVQRDAERKCAERKLVASRADSVCTMERCTTHFYCVEKE